LVGAQKMLQLGDIHCSTSSDEPTGRRRGLSYREQHTDIGDDGSYWVGTVDAATAPGVIASIPVYRLQTHHGTLCPGLREVDEDMPIARPHHLVVRGAVQAGDWRDAIEWPEADWQTFSISGLSPRPNAAQPAFGLLVRGLSMNLVFPPGTILVCVRYADLGCAPLAGDHVVCQQRQRNGLVEATIKELTHSASGWWLRPHSDSPAHQQAILLSPSLLECDPAHLHFQSGSGTDSEEIVIAARVISAFQKE